MRPFLGYVYIVATVLIWGLWGITAKLAARHNPPMAVNAISWLFFPLGAALGLVMLKLTRAPISWSPKAIGAILVFALVGMGGTFFYFLAFTRTSVSLVTTLTAVYPAVTVILAVLFLGEKFTWVQAVGLALILGGTLLVSGGAGGGVPEADDRPAAVAATRPR